MIRSQTTVRIRYRDTDQMSVVYHGVYLEFFETGRTEMLRQLGMPYSSIEQTGVLLPVLEYSARLVRPARYDDLVTVVTTIRERPTARLRIDYEIVNGEELLVTGHTLHAFATAGIMKATRPPKAFIELLERSWRSDDGSAGSIAT
jgi:acyl-CoA thioester hydrolase